MHRRRPRWLALLALAGACATGGPGTSGAEPGATAVAEPGHFVLRGGRLAGGGQADVEIRGGHIVAVGEVAAAAGVPDVDVRGRWLAPAFIDSHVHLALAPVAAELPRGGVVGRWIWARRATTSRRWWPRRRCA